MSFIENQNGWHGKTLNQEELARALPELGPVDKSVRGVVSRPEDLRPAEVKPQAAAPLAYKKGDSLATRKAYGNALKRLYPQFPHLVSLDGEVSNSTYAEIFEDAYPKQFFEMYIAEQNMVGAALGLATRGKIPFVSTFAAFFSRAFDQIRMSQYSEPNLKFCGSHAGVSIGEDGPSQMGLEDLAMFRAILDSVVLYPADAVSTERLVEEALKHHGIVYIRTSRMGTPIIYGPEEKFPLGGCKVLRQSDHDLVTVIGAGVTLYEALAAYDELQQEGINIRVIDLYSVKPVDAATLLAAAKATQGLITVEDHYPAGGIGEAVMAALAPNPVRLYALAVTKKPKTGKPAELMDFEEISRSAIVKLVKQIKQGRSKGMIGVGAGLQTRPYRHIRRHLSRNKKETAMRVGIAADHGGFELKEQLKQELKTLGHEVVDFGAYRVRPPGRLPRPGGAPGPGGGPRRGGARPGPLRQRRGRQRGGEQGAGGAGGADHRPLLRPPGGGGRRHEHHVPGRPGDLLCPGLGADPGLLEGWLQRGGALQTAPG